MRYRWTNSVKGFNMQVKVWINGKAIVLKPHQRWSNFESDLPIRQVIVDKDYYVATMEDTVID